jgi:hypothetical protein
MRTSLLRVAAPGIFILLFCIISTLAFSQQEISGTVRNKSGQGISGATVEAMPSRRAGVTDNLGNFRLSAAASDNALSISSIGFLDQRFEVTPNTDSQEGFQ